jgi:hypothetical protein
MTVPRLTRQDKDDEARREKSARKTAAALERIYDEVTRDGFERLENTSDAEWQAAVDADVGEE